MAPGDAMLFDTHAHLNDTRFDPDRGAVLDRCLAAGIARVVEVADRPADWEAAIALSRARPRMVRASIGCHPYHALDWDASVAERLSRKTALPEVVAVGEIGLDYFAKCAVPRDAQKATFLAALRLARDLAKPVVIHCRDAYQDLLPILREHYRGDPPRGGRFHGVLHCFLGGPADAAEGLALGFALGVDGPVTYPKNDALRGTLKDAGLERLVLETDSPYLPPQSSRGRRNDPSLLAEIAARVAGLFEVSPEEAARRTTANALDLYRMTPEA
ncbi:MAG: TatD family hydrolase [Elusimicrobia bacterium]|nr:TatD family hydrolase [Elusimicrobiota bacterium]